MNGPLATTVLDEFGTNLPRLLDGLQVSVVLTLLSIAFGAPLALLACLAQMSPIRPIRYAAIGFVELGRGAPALVLLQLAYFGLPSAGVVLPAMTAAIAALSWTAAAYGAEYIRGGIAAVPRREVEACHALGMTTRDTFRFVVIPQGLRIAIPSLMGFAVMLFQATSLAYSVAVPELMSQAYSIGSSTFRYLVVLIQAGVLYAAISIPFTWLSISVERRMNKHI
ncbi:amino acid ABC transporter permease [Rhodococcus sp. MEB064]|uniref:amino acid ABC transporter permease n=1 Tax=Rhodococcus sp. MEB064 TaxID=1587522 RepID=UPI0005AD1520|nr:amino acid ABC transporter permease [Rhodococcus sp. MEB064]KIQ08008.1 amino acid ABC transporter permease [Rhodococcus sp. MEB064]